MAQFQYKETAHYEGIAKELINLLAQKKCTIDEAQQILKIVADEILILSTVQEIKD